MCQQLAISDCHGGLSPQDKLEWTQKKQLQGRRVAMLGDGINDAPTLAAADVSLSFSTATDLANISSDFLILGDNPGVLVKARLLARKTRRNIMQNLIWAAAYNLVAVPFAAIGYIPPWGSAIGMRCLAKEGSIITKVTGGLTAMYASIEYMEVKSKMHIAG